MRLALAVLLLTAYSAVAQQGADRHSTRPGLEIGGQLASYDYKEPYLPAPVGLVEISGLRLGVVGALTAVSDTSAFFRIDGRASYGSLDYKGSGSATGVPDLILEARAVAGFDWALKDVTLSPYAGLGYRYLYDDLTGYSSTGAAGYRRYSNYLYAPVGLTLRFDADSEWVLATTAEVDVFIQGKQTSMLSDANPALGNPTNTQNRGIGYRLYLMFEKDRLAAGPYLHYWHIKDSDLQPIGGGASGREPENYTYEFGLELRYRF